MRLNVVLLIAAPASRGNNMNHKTAPVILTMLTAFLFLTSLTEATAGAQTPDTSPWIKVSPDGEGFTVSMPQLPVVTSEKKQHDKFSADARLYTVTNEEKAIYTIWVLSGQGSATSDADEIDDYLDACIEMVWNELEQMKSENPMHDQLGHNAMKYVGEAGPAKTFTGREYDIYQGPRRGVARIYYGGQQSYLVMALNVKPDGLKEAFQFVESFTQTAPSSPLPLKDAPVTPPAKPSAPQVYSPRDVTEKAHILSRPEPQYTETARKFQVSGTVVLKAVLAGDRQVTDISVVSRLPHGLTRASIEAVRQIKFLPATKDGREVSQSVQIEYNYNLY
jgi:TonB family protein